MDSKNQSRNPDYQPDNTTKREPPVIERKREWEHGTEGREGCQRRKQPIYTDPNSIPGPCGRDNPFAYGCGGKEWVSKGIVQRIKGSKQIVHREDSSG
jgi:hypothetical protein